MAEALGRVGQNAEGLVAIEEAIARSERTEEHWAMAELVRLKGELLLLQGAPGAAAAAVDHFRQVLNEARRQERHCLGSCVLRRALPAGYAIGAAPPDATKAWATSGRT
jgi:predicted ATPase